MRYMITGAILLLVALVAPVIAQVITSGSIISLDAIVVNPSLTIAGSGSLVNGLSVSPKATGNSTIVQGAGSDANINVALQSKGTATVFVRPGTDSSLGFSVQNAGASANILYVDTTNKIVYAGSASSFSGPLTTPASSAAACITGQIVWDAGFIYICTATNTWKRAALVAF
jgi:hypothetical protein